MIHLDAPLPHDHDAELSLLSACLQDGKSLAESSNILTPKSFYSQKHQKIFKALLRAAPKAPGHPPEFSAVASNLQAEGVVPSELAKLLETPMAIDIKAVADAVKKKAAIRKIIEVSLSGINNLLSYNGDASEAIDDFQQIIIKANTLSLPERTKRISIANVYTSNRMVDSYIQYIKTLKDNRFLTGINDIDKRIRGVSGGEVMTIIARAGSFKTAMLQNMLLNYVNHSAWSAVFFSLEMPVSSVTERYMGITMGYEGREVENTFLDFIQSGNNAEINELRHGFNARMQRIYVVPVKVSLAGVGEYVKLIESEFKVKVGVIGIDYMGLIDGDGKNEYEVVSNVARGAKELAKEINLPTVILCQASRAGGTGEEEITLDMGRGSGAIEEGGDFILGLWQDERKDGLGRPTGIFDLICRILKNRKGPKGSRWKLDVNPKDLTFGEDAVEFAQIEAKKVSKKRP